MAKLDSTTIRLRKSVGADLDAIRPAPLGSRDSFVEKILAEFVAQVLCAEPPGTLPSVQLLREMKRKPTAEDVTAEVLRRLEKLEQQMLARGPGDVETSLPAAAHSNTFKAPCPPPEIPVKYQPAERHAAVVVSGGSTQSLNEAPPREQKPISGARAHAGSACQKTRC